MISKRKLVVFLVVGMAVLPGIAATHPFENPSWQNLKIIPKNTDEDQMDRIMHRYSNALGVTCSYCHPDTKADVFPRRVDFASDENPEKNIARKMMRMTDKINKKYFDYNDHYDFDGLSKQVITCNTCHRGLPKPSNISLYIP